MLVWWIACFWTAWWCAAMGKAAVISFDQAVTWCCCVQEVFDDVVFACSAEVALKLLENPTW